MPTTMTSLAARAVDAIPVFVFVAVIGALICLSTMAGLVLVALGVSSGVAAIALDCLAARARRREMAKAPSIITYTVR